MGKNDKNKADRNSDKNAESATNPLIVNDIKGNEIDFQAFFARFEKRFDDLESKIDSVSSDLPKEITDKINEAIETLKEEIDERFDKVNVSIDKFKDEIDTRVRHHADEIYDLNNRAKRCEDRMSDAEKQILKTEIDLNNTRQRERNYSIKCYNLPCDGTDAGTVGSTIYTTLLEPAFKAAVTDKKLSVTPTLVDLCDAAHKLPLSTAEAAKGNLTPPIQFRFRSRFLRDIFFTYSKAVIARENAKPAYTSHPIRVAKDLTPINRQLMVKLYNDATVEKQWLAGSNIRFVLKADLNTVRTVVNPFGANKDELTKIVT